MSRVWSTYSRSNLFTFVIFVPVRFLLKGDADCDTLKVVSPSLAPPQIISVILKPTTVSMSPSSHHMASIHRPIQREHQSLCYALVLYSLHFAASYKSVPSNVPPAKNLQRLISLLSVHILIGMHYLTRNCVSGR